MHLSLARVSMLSLALLGGACGTPADPAGTLAALFALASLVLAAEEIRKALARRRAGAVLRD